MAEEPAPSTTGKGEAAPQRDPIHMANMVTAAMLALTIVVCCAALLIAVSWPRSSPLAGRVEPTLFGLPSATPGVAGPTLNPPSTEEIGGQALAPQATLPAESTQPGGAPLVTATEALTAAPTLRATATLTETPTVTPTLTPTLTLTPTITNTPLPFSYVLRNGTIIFGDANVWRPGVGCGWQGIAGFAFNLNDQHVKGLLVHVWRADGILDVRVATGSAAGIYGGDSAWEVVVSSSINDDIYYVQLESPTQEVLSDVVAVDFNNTCAANHALVTFDQVQ
ncbi:MAG: hypothetical protein Kow00124_19620 [Anaerolineae bacterium]